MDTLPKEKQWSEDERAEFRKFWDSKIGQKYLQRIKDTKEEALNYCMGTTEPDAINHYAGMANGFNSLLLDIEFIGKSEAERKADEEKLNKKEVAAKK